MSTDIASINGGATAEDPSATTGNSETRPRGATATGTTVIHPDIELGELAEFGTSNGCDTEMEESEEEEEDCKLSSDVNLNILYA